MTGFVKKKPADILPFKPVSPGGNADSKSSAPGSIPGTGATPAVPAPLPGGPLFDVSVRYVMENEDGVNWDHDKGEYTNDPRDPGGRTIWGIIQTEYEAYLGRPLTENEVKGMPRETAMEIYKKNFWLPIHGDSYAYQACATAIMDTAVNKGLGGCMVILTDALHQHFEVRYGVDLIAAVNSLSPKTFLSLMEAATERYIAARIARFPSMTWARAGWTNRAKRLLQL